MVGTPGENKKKVFSLTSFGVLVLIVVIAVDIVMWRSNLEKQSQINVLHYDMAQVQQKIQGMPGPPSDLDARLAAAQAGLTEAQRALPAAVNRDDVIDFIIGTAEQCSVDVIPLVVGESSYVKAGQSYRALRFSVTVTGSLENVTDFMTNLRGGQFPTLVITECTVTKTENMDYSRPEYSTQVKIDLSFAVYTATSEANAS